jgi:hypothetical protein
MPGVTHAINKTAFLLLNDHFTAIPSSLRGIRNSMATIQIPAEGMLITNQRTVGEKP